MDIIIIELMYWSISVKIISWPSAIIALTVLFTIQCRSSKKGSSEELPPPEIKVVEDTRLRATAYVFPSNRLYVFFSNNNNVLQGDKSYRLDYGPSKDNECVTNWSHNFTMHKEGKLKLKIFSEQKLWELEQVTACIVDTESDTVIAWAKSEKRNTEPNLPQSGDQGLSLYSKECATEIEELPIMNCLDGEILPITVNGATPTFRNATISQVNCDNPPLLELSSNGQCIPYSRVQRVASYDPDVLTVLNCRRYELRGENSPYFDDVAVIQHRKSTGATCFFQGKLGAGLRSDRIPPPTESPSETPSGELNVAAYWQETRETVEEGRCFRCHEADPFVHSPYIQQAKDVVPSVPLGKYKIVGRDFQSWTRYAIDVEGGNSCTSCHRIGSQKTCEKYVEQSVGLELPRAHLASVYQFPHSHWMPPGEFTDKAAWDSAYLNDAQRLISCCNNPNQSFCIRTRID